MNKNKHEPDNFLAEQCHSQRVLNYNQISDLIYIGNNMCCQTHFERKLLSKGIEADLSLEGERLDAPRGVKYFFWLPFADMTAPSPQLLWLGVKILEALEAQQIKTYVHCKNGHGRAPTAVAAYFIYKGFSYKQAISLIKERRPVIHLTDVQQRRLEEFELRVRKKGDDTIIVQ